MNAFATATRFALSAGEFTHTGLSWRSHRIEGQGTDTVLRHTGAGDAFLTQGGLGSSSALTMDAEAMTRTVTVADPSLFPAGSYVLINDTVPWQEIRKVRSVAVNTLTLDGSLLQPFRVANAARVYQCTPVVGPRISDLILRGGGGNALSLGRCLDWRVERVLFDGIAGRAIQDNAGNLQGGKVIDCTFDACGGDFYPGCGSFDNYISGRSSACVNASIIAQGCGPNEFDWQCDRPGGTHLQLEASFGWRGHLQGRGGLNDGFIVRNWASGGPVSRANALMPGSSILGCDGDAAIFTTDGLPGRYVEDNALHAVELWSKLGNAFVAYDAPRSRVLGCVARDSRTVSAAGFAFTGASSRSVLEGNTSRNNHYGLRAETVSYCTITGNPLEGNVQDLYTNLLGPGNVIKQNPPAADL